MSQDTASSTPVRKHRRRRTILLIAIALILVVAISLVAVSCQTGDETGPPTVTVDRGTVALAVSASGSIAPGGRQSLGFADGGTVTQVLVNVGDQVQPGQLLARIDDTVARQTLAQREATLDQQLATLNKLVGGNSVEAAQASLDKAQDIERATRRQVDATNAVEPLRDGPGPHAAELRPAVAGPRRAAAGGRPGPRAGRARAPPRRPRPRPRWPRPARRPSPPPSRPAPPSRPEPPCPPEPPCRPEPPCPPEPPCRPEPPCPPAPRRPR